MKAESDYKLPMLLSICLITVLIEAGLSVWSSHVIGQLDFNGHTVATIQLASEGVMTYVTLFWGTLITTSVSLIIPQIRVLSLYNQITDKRFHKIATVAVLAYILVPTANTVASIIGGYTLLSNAGISLFDLIIEFR